MKHNILNELRLNFVNRVLNFTFSTHTFNFTVQMTLNHRIQGRSSVLHNESNAWVFRLAQGKNTTVCVQNKTWKLISDWLKLFFVSGSIFFLVGWAGSKVVEWKSTLVYRLPYICKRKKKEAEARPECVCIVNGRMLRLTAYTRSAHSTLPTRSQERSLGATSSNETVRSRRNVSDIWVRQIRWFIISTGKKCSCTSTA